MRNILVGLSFLLLSGCGVLYFQQPLPGSLWGEWAIDRTGPAEDGSQTYRFWNECEKYDDVLHFSSDRKMTFRWRDDRCTMYYAFLGKYTVDKENHIMHVELDKTPNRDEHPFPPITQFKIEIINETTLQLKEMEREKSSRVRSDRGSESTRAIRFVLRRVVK
ncbi:MAG: hypothetical protein GX102_03355 [Porphyromonadaceae bacterium]|jgi:hypothetical protein|nr:hypothetical protein [Porphyromonadaceae bacterium]